MCPCGRNTKVNPVTGQTVCSGCEDFPSNCHCKKK